MTQIIAGTDEDFALYSGDDALTLPVLAIGGVGVVSVASHIAGKELQKIVEAFISGNLKEAARLHQELLPLIKVCLQRQALHLSKQLFSYMELTLDR